MRVERVERGWAGHFILGHRCAFRRNTLLRHGDAAVVVSTVGALLSLDELRHEEVGVGRYYETAAFAAKSVDGYWDADVSRRIEFEAPWFVGHAGITADREANDMHERVVEELTLHPERWGQ